MFILKFGSIIHNTDCCSNKRNKSTKDDSWNPPCLTNSDFWVTFCLGGAFGGPLTLSALSSHEVTGPRVCSLRRLPWSSRKLSGSKTKDSKTLEHGCRLICAGCPSFFGLRSEDQLSGFYCGQGPWRWGFGSKVPGLNLCAIHRRQEVLHFVEVYLSIIRNINYHACVHVHINVFMYVFT